MDKNTQAYEPLEDLRGFCAAPWVEAVLYNDGHLQACCRNPRDLGPWQREGLPELWHGAGFIAFREAILSGRFPDSACAKCHENGTSRSLSSELTATFEHHMRVLKRHLNSTKRPLLSLLSGISSQFELRQKNSATDAAFEEFHRTHGSLRATDPALPGEALMSLDKLLVIANTAESFLQGDLRPRHVAPFRQVELTNRCNARCVMCPGKYTGTIQDGTVLDDSHLDAAYARPGDIISHFMNGAEFLFYKNWKDIAENLLENGVKLAVSSNAILLGPETVRYLVDREAVLDINVSMDGATKDTVESIRKNVNFQSLIKNVAYLFAYASSRRYSFNFSVSFVLMKRNYREFPLLVGLVSKLLRENYLPSFRHEAVSAAARLINRLLGLFPKAVLNGGRLAGVSKYVRKKMMGRYRYPGVSVFCQALEQFDVPGYDDFVRAEHHSRVEPEKLRQAFLHAFRESERAGVPVNVFYHSPIKAFIEQGYPFPKLSM